MGARVEPREATSKTQQFELPAIQICLVDQSDLKFLLGRGSNSAAGSSSSMATHKIEMALAA